MDIAPFPFTSPPRQYISQAPYQVDYGMCYGTSILHFDQWYGEGYFRNTPGLRQGCPLSPFPFAMIMEFFSFLMSQYTSSHLIPTPFHKVDVSISHLMFANDFIAFSKATHFAAGNSKHFLENFRIFSDLAIK